MWKNEFTESVITERKFDRVMVSCETEDDAVDLFELLKDNGYRWASGLPIHPLDNCWNAYGQKTCYIVDPKRRTFLYGEIGGSYEKKFDDSRKFVYRPAQNFIEPTTDDLLLLLGVG